RNHDCACGLSHRWWPARGLAGAILCRLARDPQCVAQALHEMMLLEAAQVRCQEPTLHGRSSFVELRRIGSWHLRPRDRKPLASFAALSDWRRAFVVARGRYLVLSRPTVARPVAGPARRREPASRHWPVSRRPASSSSAFPAPYWSKTCPARCGTAARASG